MEWLGSLSELLRYIKNLGYGAALGAGSLGSIYFIICCLTINNSFSFEYLPLVLTIGALLGYGVQRIVVLTYKRNDKLKDFQIGKQITQEKLNLIQENIDRGLLTPSQASEMTEQVIKEFVLIDKNPVSNNILESREQRQIPQSQEEE